MDPVQIPISKRFFDIVASSIVLMALFPLMLVFLILYCIEQLFIPSSRGTLFYKEIRISQGKPFLLWKIRTFKLKVIADAQLKGKTIHTKELERDKNNLTLTGRVLRQIYMDEMPQIFSVLIGDMSFVGPRPTNVFNYEQSVAKGLLAKKILKAGLTGRFQTHKHVKYKLNQEQVDMNYAEFCRKKTGFEIITYDLLILLQTVVTVIRAEGL